MKYLFLFVSAIFFCFPFVVHAEDAPHFELKATFTYELTDTGVVKVREEVHIKNLTTENYAPSFTFDTTGFTPDDISVFESGLASKLTKTDDHTFTVNFKRPALGKGANKNVVILFSDSTLLTKHGGVTEIHIPRVQNREQFSSLVTIIRVSQDASKSFHVFPKTGGVSRGQFVEYTFDSEGGNSPSISAFLGDIAAYDFSLKYPFANSSFFEREVAFALPPDTAFQKVYIHSFSQEPDSLTYDSDGNWIGKITLKPRESTLFEVSGTIFVYADTHVNFPLVNADAVSLNTSAQKYWEADDPKIQELAKKLVTPEAIYNYVVQNLQYDYTKTARPQERLGAKQTLVRRSEAICMEFTDLFIALSRAAHIPAREINGFAISDDDSHPRGLGEDILHSWPEYWDATAKKWIPVDPTWGNTTHGVDYFSHFDLNHIAFVIHGASSTFPQTPGTYDTQDQDAELIHVMPSVEGQKEETTAPQVTITKKGISLWQSNYVVTVKNVSGQALYNTEVQVFSDEVPYMKKTLVSILPFSTVSFEISLYTGFFGSKLPHTVLVSAGEVTAKVTVSKFEIWSIHFIVLLLPFILVPMVVVFMLKNHAKH